MIGQNKMFLEMQQKSLLPTHLQKADEWLHQIKKDEERGERKEGIQYNRRGENPQNEGKGKSALFPSIPQNHCALNIGGTSSI